MQRKEFQEKVTSRKKASEIQAITQLFNSQTEVSVIWPRSLPTQIQLSTDYPSGLYYVKPEELVQLSFKKVSSMFNMLISHVGADACCKHS